MSLLDSLRKGFRFFLMSFGSLQPTQEAGPQADRPNQIPADNPALPAFFEP